MLEFRILGPLEVGGENGTIQLGGPRQRATLAILLLHANRVVPVEQLADDLYAGRPPVTAVTQVQRQVSELRRALGSAGAIETRPPGYVLRVRDQDFDLACFERLTAEAGHARAREDAAAAAALLDEALSLWRGPPLADLAYEQFARAPVERLEELRLTALEERIDAELMLGRHATVVSELEGLAAEHPLRERLRGQQMLALYRSGRQADALEVYRETREQLVSSFGIDPSAPLRALEHAILTQDDSLELGVPQTGRGGAVLVAPSCDDALSTLLPLATAFAAGNELVVARIVAEEHELDAAAAALRACGATARTAAFTSGDPAADLVRLATNNDADLVLVDAPPGIDGAQLPEPLVAAARAHARAGRDPRPGPGSLPGAVHVPFGGGEHDWAALELGAWLASATGSPLRLVGTRAICGAVDATPAVSWRMRRSPCSGWSRSRRRRCSRNPTPRRCSKRWRTAPWSPSASRHAGASRESAPPAAPSSATRGRRSCSSTVACALAGSPRARTAPASPGRSVL